MALWFSRTTACPSRRRSSIISNAPPKTIKFKASAPRRSEVGPVLARLLTSLEIAPPDRVGAVEAPGGRVVDVGEGATVVEEGWLSGRVVTARGGCVVADAAGCPAFAGPCTIPGASAAITPVTSTIAASAKVTRETTEDGTTTEGR
jgi:hypothetical protein